MSDESPATTESLPLEGYTPANLNPMPSQEEYGSSHSEISRAANDYSERSKATIRDVDLSLAKKVREGRLDLRDGLDRIWAEKKRRVGESVGLENGITDRPVLLDPKTGEPADPKVTLSLRDIRPVPRDRDGNLTRASTTSLSTSMVEYRQQRDAALLNELVGEMAPSGGEAALPAVDEQPAEPQATEQATEQAQPADPKQRAQAAWERTWAAMSAEEQTAYRQQYDQAAAAQQQAVAEQAQQFEAAIRHTQAMALIDIQQELAANGVISAQDLANLAQRDPTKYGQIQAKADRVKSLAAAAQQHLHQQATVAQQRQSAEVARWATQQDQALVNAVPELADSAKRAEIESAIYQYAQDRLGATKEQVDAAVANDPRYRDAAFRVSFIDAAKQHAAAKRAQQALRDNKDRTPSPTLKPGVSQPRESGRFVSGEYARLNRALDTATGTRAVRIAAQMRQMRARG